MTFLYLLLTLLMACQPEEVEFECVDAIGCVEILPDEPIKVGILQALSGALAPVGIEQTRIFELVLDEQDHQLLGHTVELLIEDSLCTPEGGKNSALNITTRQDVIAVFGTTCSSSAVTAAKIVSDAGMVIVSGTNGAPALTSINGEQGENWHPGYFRTIYNGVMVGQAVGTYAYQILDINKAATVKVGDAYSQGYTEMFEQTFLDLGGQITLSAGINIGDSNMIPVLTAIANSKADLIFMPIFPPEAEKFLLQKNEVPELENVILIGAEGLMLGSFIDAVGQEGIGMYFAGPVQLTGGNITDLGTKYETKFGVHPNTIDFGFAHDAANLILKTIEAVAEQADDGTIYIGQQALRDAIYATKNFPGLTGMLTCDSFGDCGVARFNIVRLTDPAAGLDGLLSNIVYEYLP